MKQRMTEHPSFCLAPFISDHVAAWQRSGNAERNSESIMGLISVGNFANRDKVGNGQWLPAKVTSQIGKPNAGLAPASISVPGVSSSFI
jgi:hypothetical protein